MENIKRRTIFVLAMIAPVANRQSEF